MGGEGIFTDKTAEAGCPGNDGQGRAVSFADFNADGNLDLFMVSATSENQMYINDGTGHFTDMSKQKGVDSIIPAQGMNVADVDGDGDLDIYVSNILASGALYENDGNGNFKDSTSAAGLDYHLFGQGVAFGDVNGDGAIDMYVCTWGTPLMGWPSRSNKLFINQGNFPNWIKVRPLDESGHATLLGTQVRVFQADTRQLAAPLMQIDGGSGFCSQNAYDAYFGFGFLTALPVYDIEMRCGGDWVTKETVPSLGGISADRQTILQVKCQRSASKSSAFSTAAKTLLSRNSMQYV